MAKFCGPLYFVNMVATVAAYCKFTQYVGNQRLKLIQERTQMDKAQEYFIDQSATQHETVKAFGAESYEQGRFNDITDELKFKAVNVQKNLTFLNIG